MRSSRSLEGGYDMTSHTDISTHTDAVTHALHADPREQGLFSRMTFQRQLSIAVTLGVLLAAQVTLGVSNILMALNLAVAVGHNAIAALLLVTLVVLNCALAKKSSR